jgi:hypothetical protein
VSTPTLRARRTASAVIIYLIILVSLQVFLVTVAAEAFATGDKAVAWAAAVVSVVLAAGAAFFLRYLHA